MADFSHHPPMSFENPYTFVDPFQVSIIFSVKNLIQRHQGETTIDDIPLPPPQRYLTHVPPPTPVGREQSLSDYSLSLSRISSRSRQSPSASPPASSNRNTFGISAHNDKDRSHMPSPPKLGGSKSSVFLPPQPDREARSSVSRNFQQQLPTSIGSAHTSHRRRNLPPTDVSREPEIVLEHRHPVARHSSDAIPFYKPSTRTSEVALASSSPHATSFIPPKHEYQIPPPPPPVEHHPHHLTTYIFACLLDTLPRQIYLYLMLRLPHLYFTHVIRIFEDAEMSMPEIKKMALEANNYLKDPTISKALHLESGFGSPRYYNLSKSWEAFVDSLIREWKTMNIISVLLLSALLTVLQIPSAANDPVTRYAALVSMMCAVMSLLYGSIYVIRFGTMRSASKAAEWAHEAQRPTTGIFWNVWVLLAMPATWLSWSIIFFVVSIMAFVWRTGTIEDANQTPITSHDALAPRIIVTLVFSLGLVYFILIRNTFKRYGTAMDRAWRTRVLVWMHGNNNIIIPSIDLRPTSFQEFVSPGSKRSPSPRNAIAPVAVSDSEKERPRGRSTAIKPISTASIDPHRLPSTSATSGKPEIKQTKILDLSSPPADVLIPSQEMLISYQMMKDDWDRLDSEIRSSWDPDQLSMVQDILRHWNQTFFRERGAQIVLCEEFNGVLPSSHYAIYHFPWKDELPTGRDSYDPIPQNLTRLDVYSLPSSGAPGFSLF